ncbi:hypothetical protein E2C01_093011 [Portunus trituberculatus]|uniref:Uncharacterized protein n=1 Tax=Portunus trituberculatus TaxID=210409 RepID=A0A5B7JTR9_PORTR|nr:hypothetical protein [Portunus trituberculatus]
MREVEAGVEVWGAKGKPPTNKYKVGVSDRMRCVVVFELVYGKFDIFFCRYVFSIIH